jgi:GntR family transcriptional regulator
VVRESLLKRIRKGEWRPGELLPNEFEIAAEHGVSQGTARKAIADLASEGILTRQQGRGTYVTEHGSDRGLAHFPQFVDDNQKRVEFGSLPCTFTKGAATSEERAALHLPPGANVLRLYRLRTVDGHAVMSEAITLPQRLFRTFRPEQATGSLYDVYQRTFGVHVVHHSDRLSAVPADKKRARELGVDVGAPLLRIERVARAIDNQKVEWRVSLCPSSRFHYLNNSD